MKYQDHHGVLFGVCAAFALSIMATLVKLAYTVSNESIVFFRFLVGFILFYLFTGQKQFKLSLQKVPKYLVRSLSGLFAMYFFYYALKKIPLVTAVTLSSTTPIFIPLVLLAWKKVAVSKRRFFASIIGFIGVLIILRPTEGLAEWASFSALLAGFCGAIALVGLRYLAKTESSDTILLYYFVISTTASFVPMIYAWTPIVHISLWLLLFSIGVCGFLFQFFLTLSYKYAPATKASISSYFAVIFSGITDWLIWKKVPDYGMWIGIILIIAGGVIALLDPTPPKILKK